MRVSAQLGGRFVSVQWASGLRTRIQVLSKAQESNQRWSTDLCRVWGRQAGWLNLALVMDCHTCELLG